MSDNNDMQILDQVLQMLRPLINDEFDDCYKTIIEQTVVPRIFANGIQGEPSFLGQAACVDKILKHIEDAIYPLNEELLKVQQERTLAQEEAKKVDKKVIEDIFTKFFRVISNIRLELCSKPEDFDQYLDEIRKLTKYLGMEIYCYNEGEEFPDNVGSILSPKYEKTDKPELDNRVCRTELIGFRVNKLDIKSGGRVFLYRYDPKFKPVSEPPVPLTQGESENIDKLADGSDNGHSDQTFQESKVSAEELFQKWRDLEMRTVELLRNTTFDKNTSESVLTRAEFLVNEYPEGKNLGIVENLIEYYRNNKERQSWSKVDNLERLAKKIKKNEKKVKR